MVLNMGTLVRVKFIRRNFLDMREARNCTMITKFVFIKISFSVV